MSKRELGRLLRKYNSAIRNNMGNMHGSFYSQNSLGDSESKQIYIPPNDGTAAGNRGVADIETFRENEAKRIEYLVFFIRYYDEIHSNLTLKEVIEFIEYLVSNDIVFEGLNEELYYEQFKGFINDWRRLTEANTVESKGPSVRF